MDRIHKIERFSKRGKQAAGGILAACLLFLFLEKGRWILPLGIPWMERRIVLQANPAFIEGEIVVEGKQLQYLHDGEILYTLDRKYKVADAAVEDIDHDGMVEVAMLVWTRGDYGDAHPSFEQPNRFNYTARFYLFSIEEEGLKPKWMSSRLPFEAFRMQVDENGRVFLQDRSGREISICWKHWGMEACD